LLWARGVEPTVTDACLVLGYIDGSSFLDGDMLLDGSAARAALSARIAEPLGVEVDQAAEMVMRLAIDVMARAIEHVCLEHGLDPRRATLIGGGGAAGLAVVDVAREIRCPRVFVPAVATALSAVGALTSPIIAEYIATAFATSVAFPFDDVNRVLRTLKERCESFVVGSNLPSDRAEIEFSADARYAHQVWEIETPWRSRGSPPRRM
jgi:N-methylhydantoinase A